MPGYSRLLLASRARTCFLVIPTALFICNAVVGISARNLDNSPTCSAFRRLTLLFVVAAEYLFFNNTHFRSFIQTIVIVTIGAIISGIDDLFFSRLGYCLDILNSVLTAAYHVSVRRALKDKRLEPLAPLYFTALLDIPLVGLLLITTRELAHVTMAFCDQPELLSWGFLASLVATAAWHSQSTFSKSLWTSVTLPLTTSVAEQVENVTQTLLGFFMCGFAPTGMSTVGFLTALRAQIWFEYLKYLKQHGKKKSSDERE